MGHQWRFRKTDLDRWIEGQSPAQRAGEHQSSPIPRRPAHVLVVDDEAPVRDTLTSILALTDFTVDAVADGNAAVTRLRAESYDLLITDLRMPGLDGIGVAREAKRLNPGIKVVIVTGFPSQSSAIDAINIGVDGYLTKPFRPMDVLMASARALDLGTFAGQPDRN
jgi:DNA-binding response OmpR family regulator